jgi:ribose/xylose/arabinose/galactoside ABC-type transport system permease subunit
MPESRIGSIARAAGQAVWPRLSEHLVLALAITYFLCLAPFTPGFATGSNLHNILLTLIPLFLVAAGQTVVMITGGIDLAQTSILAVCSVASAWVMTTLGGAFGMAGGIAAALLAGLLVGAVNGIIVAGLRVPAFIATLTTMMFFSGLAIWLTRSQNIGGLPAAFNALGTNLLAQLAAAVVIACVLHTFLSRTIWGRWVYASGGNPQAARISGVPVSWVVFSAYLVSGLLCACAALLYTAQAENGSPVLGQRLLLDVIGATVIGGTSLFGGRGKVLSTLFGVLFLKLIDNSLNLLDLSYFSIMMVKGVVILFAAGLDTARARSGSRGAS